MRVALVVAGDLGTESGGYRYDRRLRARLRARSHDVDVHRLPVDSYARQLAANGRRLGDRLSGYDVVVEDGLAGPSLLLANRRLAVPTVAVVHFLRSRWPGGVGRLAARIVSAIERRFLRSVDAAIYPSDDTRLDASRLGCRAPGIVAPPGGDRFEPVSAGAWNPTETANGPLDVCFLGSVVERKGLDVLVEGLARTNVDWRLTAVGDPTVEPGYVDDIRRRAAALDVAGRVDLAGRLPDDAVARHLEAADVIAVPSRYEPFGIAYLEGMAHGCVPVASARGGADEFVTHDENGFVVEPTPASVVRVLDRLAGRDGRPDRDRLAELSLAARTAYERQPTWTESLDRVAGFLERLGGESGPSRPSGRSGPHAEVGDRLSATDPTRTDP